MQPNAKVVHFEDIFPYLGISDEGAIVTKRGNISLGWELTLPELYSTSEEGYDNMSQAMGAAIRNLPPWSVVHRQDIYTYSTWHAAPSEEGKKKAFLVNAYDKHFEGRRYLTHRAYIFLTMGTMASVLKESRYSGFFGIAKSNFSPKLSDWDYFRTKASEFTSILKESGIGIRQLEKDDYIGSENEPGIINRYVFLGDQSGQLSDIEVEKSCIRCFDKEAIAFNLYQAEDLPPVVSSVRKNDIFSIDEQEIVQSCGAGIGPLLDCEHIVNTYIVVPDQMEEKSRLVKEQKKMMKGRDVAENKMSADQIDEYVKRMYNESPLLVKANINIIAWDRPEKKTELFSKVSSAVSSLGAASTLVRYNTPLLWYAGMPGNALELGSDNLMTMELNSCLCFLNWDTFQQEMKKGMFRITDRIRHIPLIIDTQKVAQSMGRIFDLNAFVLGPSGTGKSFFMNYYVESCYNAGESVFIIDVGDSYEILCNVIRESSGGKDGQYMTWDINNPLQFNPFIGFEDWLDEDGNVKANDAGANFFLSVLQSMWRPEKGWNAVTRPVLRQIVADFVKHIQNGLMKMGRRPIFDDFYNYVKGTVAPAIRNESFKLVKDSIGLDDFNIDDFTKAISSYAKGRTYGFLLNAETPPDLFSSRFVVFEVSELANGNNPDFYSLCILCIMNNFDMKMRQSLGFKVMVIEEAWKAISNETFEPYLRELWKTSRKYSCSAVVVTQQAEDINSSPVIKDAILKNSSLKFLLNQYNNKQNFSPIVDALGLSQGDVRKVFSMDRGKDTRYRYRDIFIKMGESYSGVFSTEVSRKQALAFESDKTRKAPLIELAKKKGSYTAAINELANS